MAYTGQLGKDEAGGTVEFRTFNCFEKCCICRLLPLFRGHLAFSFVLAAVFLLVLLSYSTFGVCYLLVFCYLVLGWASATFCFLRFVFRHLFLAHDFV